MSSDTPKYEAGQEVWVRGKVMSIFSDEIVVAPYAHRSGGGSIAVKFEDVLPASVVSLHAEHKEPSDEKT